MGRVAPILLCLLALAGCGGGQSTDREPIPPAPVITAAPPPPSGPLVRICDRSLATRIESLLRSIAPRRPPGSQPVANGTAWRSSCDLAPDVEITLDAETDAVRRYMNRVVESAQFSEGDRSRAPVHVGGIGDPRLRQAGANWLPHFHQLLSARGERVLIVDVNARGLSDSQRLAAARAISLDVWRRLGSRT